MPAKTEKQRKFMGAEWIASERARRPRPICQRAARGLREQGQGQQGVSQSRPSIRAPEEENEQGTRVPPTRPRVPHVTAEWSDGSRADAFRSGSNPTRSSRGRAPRGTCRSEAAGGPGFGGLDALPTNDIVHQLDLGPIPAARPVNCLHHGWRRNENASRRLRVSHGVLLGHRLRQVIRPFGHRQQLSPSGSAGLWLDDCALSHRAPGRTGLSTTGPMHHHSRYLPDPGAVYGMLHGSKILARPTATLAPRSASRLDPGGQRRPARSQGHALRSSGAHAVAHTPSASTVAARHRERPPPPEPEERPEVRHGRPGSTDRKPPAEPDAGRPPVAVPGGHRCAHGPVRRAPRQLVHLPRWRVGRRGVLA